MNYSNTPFTLDVQIHQAQVSVPVTFGDSARRLCIGLTDGRKPYVIEEGCIAVFNATKPDGSTITNACNIENNTIIYEFTEKTTNCEGIVYCDITIYDAYGRVLTTPQFIIVVDKRVVRSDDILPTDETTAFFTYEAQRQAAEAERQRLEQNRKENEISRCTNETDRIKAETERDNTFKTKMTEWEEEFAHNEEQRNNSIVQVLSDATDKVPSVGLLNRNIKTLTPKIDFSSHLQDLEEGRFVVRDAKYAEKAEFASEAQFAISDYNGNIIHETYATKSEVAEQLGDINTALDSIITAQELIIGGDENG